MWRKHGQALRERERGRGRERAMSFWGGLNHLYGGSSSGFPLANHLALLGSESVFGLTRVLLCAWASISQDGFKCKGLWEVDRTYYGLAPPPLRILSAHA